MTEISEEQASAGTERRLTIDIGVIIDDVDALREWAVGRLSDGYSFEPAWSPPPELRREFGIDADDEVSTVDVVLSTSDYVFRVDTEEGVVNLLETVLGEWVGHQVPGIDVVTIW
ncbi:hypothetical protein [Rhabdothermincola salaria]|uniref:hypothetical protein n=1 Tax=Rhabdothermincola salaria TaxID=2903142 RepID=UPI001E5FBAEB|nr:hypothetical protein [Rhabdothermincola salaria]MCD9625274.1 hypothetical protein [Rhabdothermincola salaria]